MGSRAPSFPSPAPTPASTWSFPVLHGTFGEDGTVQGLLELAELPYVGAGVLGSSLAMDKDAMKRICRERGLAGGGARGRAALGHGSGRDHPSAFGLPVFVKPANLGSSVGISKAKTREELRAALDLAAQFDRKIIVERAIDGRELECAVLGNDDPVASLPCEVLPVARFLRLRGQVPSATRPSSSCRPI